MLQLLTKLDVQAIIQTVYPGAVDLMLTDRSVAFRFHEQPYNLEGPGQMRELVVKYLCNSLATTDVIRRLAELLNPQLHVDVRGIESNPFPAELSRQKLLQQLQQILTPRETK